jgi:putative transposase
LRDNGSDFHGEALRRGCEEYGIKLEFRPLGRPHFGGHIERLIGTLMQRVHTLPGTTYSNPQQRGDYHSEKNACLTLKELERWLAMDICTLYHGSVHRSLDTAPLVAWEHAIETGRPRSLPQDSRRFLISQAAELAIINSTESIDFALLKFVSEKQHLQPH